MGIIHQFLTEEAPPYIVLDLNAVHVFVLQKFRISVGYW